MRQQVNFYHKEFRKVIDLFTGQRIVFYVGILLCLLLIDYSQRIGELSELQTNLRQLKQNLTFTQAQYEKEKKKYIPERPDAALNAKIQTLNTELLDKKAILKSIDFAEVNDVRGFSPYFIALSRQSIPEVWLTELTLNQMDNIFVIAGQTIAPEYVPQYLASLSRETIFAGLKFRNMKINRQEPKSEEDPAIIDFLITSMPVDFVLEEGVARVPESFQQQTPRVTGAATIPGFVPGKPFDPEAFQQGQQGAQPPATPLTLVPNPLELVNGN
jgi:hypothetical protein